MKKKQGAGVGVGKKFTGSPTLPGPVLILIYGTKRTYSFADMSAKGLESHPPNLMHSTQ